MKRIRSITIPLNEWRKMIFSKDGVELVRVFLWNDEGMLNEFSFGNALAFTVVNRSNNSYITRFSSCRGLFQKRYKDKADITITDGRYDCTTSLEIFNRIVENRKSELDKFELFISESSLSEVADFSQTNLSELESFMKDLKFLNGLGYTISRSFKKDNINAKLIVLNNDKIGIWSKSGNVNSFKTEKIKYFELEKILENVQNYNNILNKFNGLTEQAVRRRIDDFIFNADVFEEVE